MLVKEISLPKGSTQNCFISDNFPHFLWTFHNSLPSTSEKKINKNTFQKWVPTSISTRRNYRHRQHGDHGEGPEASGKITFTWEMEQSPLGAQSTQGCVLLFFSRKDKWLTTKKCRPPLCQRLGRKLSGGLNWSLSSLSAVYLHVCFLICSLDI